MSFRRVPRPRREDRPYVSIGCQARSHESTPWSIATFVLMERWTESPWYVEKGFRVAERKGRGSLQSIAGGDEPRQIDERSANIFDPDLRLRYKLKCHLCGDSVELRQESAQRVLQFLRLVGPEVPLPMVRRAIVESSTRR